MTMATLELAPLSPNFRTTPAGGRLATTYDLTCNRPHAWWIFSGIGFRTPRPCHKAIAAHLRRRSEDKISMHLFCFSKLNMMNRG
ncbi:hypothetical protein AVEN_18602-1 [Araneus ventricosus]|uniref:Uncharacterized protein n=1 Tax=Araneus ventricosus TaxID=182803 RepID=A0A4Y2FQL3_ARAVE|nr:hypothetical protein AVEN_18602-1 [Araneus ventricosus]